MRYRVHCYVVVRVPVYVEAESHKDAMEKAANDTDFHSLFTRNEIEYAEEISGYLVDEDGDEEYDHSCAYDTNMEPYTGVVK